MTKPVKKIFIALVSIPMVLLLLSSVLAVAFEDKVADAVLTRVYQVLDAEVRHEQVSLNLWRKFPDVTLEVRGLEVEVKRPDSDLASIGKVYLQFSLWDLLRGEYCLKKADVRKVVLKLHAYADATNNWDVFRSSEDTSETAFSLKLSAVQFSDVSVRYADASEDVSAAFNLRRLVAKGDFTQDSFTMKCSLQLRLESVKSDTTFDWGAVTLKAKGDVAVDWESQRYSVRNFMLGLDRESFQVDGKLWCERDSLWNYAFQLDGQSVSVGRLLESAPAAWTAPLADYRVGGSLDLRLKASGGTGKEPLQLQAAFSVRKGEVWQEQNNVGLEDASFRGTLEAGAPDFATSVKLVLEQLEGKLPAGNIQAEGSAACLNAPQVQLHLKTVLRLQDLKAFFPALTAARMAGETEADIRLEQTFPPFSEIGLEHFCDASISGSMKLENGVFQLDSSSVTLEDFSAALSLSGQDVHIARFTGDIQGSRCELSGKVSHWLDYLCDKVPLQLHLRLASPYLNIDPFLPSTTASSAAADKSESRGVRMPSDMNAEVLVEAQRLKFDRFEASRIQGKLLLGPGKLSVRDFSMEALGGKTMLEGDAVARSDGRFLLKAEAQTRQVDVQRLFYVLHDFGMESSENGLTHQHIRGTAKTEAHFSAILDSTLEMLPESIDCDANVSVLNGRLLNFKPLESLSSFIDLGDLKEIRFDTLTNRIGIHRSVVQIPEMEIRNSALNLFLSGSQTFMGDLHYNIKLHVGELLAKKRRARVKSQEFGEVEDDGSKGMYLYLLVAGTTDDPVFKWNREKAREGFKDNLQQQRQELKSLFGGDKKENGSETPVSPAKEEKKKLNDSKQKPSELEVDDDW